MCCWCFALAMWCWWCFALATWRWCLAIAWCFLAIFLCFPALVGVGLLVSAVLLAFELRAERRARPVPPADADAGGEARVPTRVLVGAVAWLALYYACLEPVGYLLSTLAFLAGMLSYFHRGHWRANAVIAVAFTLVVDALFTYALGIPLAEGILHI